MQSLQEWLNLSRNTLGRHPQPSVLNWGSIHIIPWEIISWGRVYEPMTKACYKEIHSSCHAYFPPIFEEEDAMTEMIKDERGIVQQLLFLVC